MNHQIKNRKGFLLKRKSILSILIIGLIFQIFCAKTKEATDKNKVGEWISGNALVVDVRTPQEFESGHYTNAVNIPLDQISSRLEEFGPLDRKIVLYCRSGRRSQEGLKTLQSKGYSNVLNAGGLTDLP
ncbi:rhodanese-like domain-containing protein [Leptospira stimsonii]|uniref:Rhodanese-like domain-containing protein n=1 Tax=Leptospira stimsonii TaxID=2202203 RepID=A0A8B3CNN9_9LEPT|nr:rhodanese-like domain-containing protein [Leptospira stimsonii]RHX83761.1 rhodanese-like domain-containing protein [Leptospira stimsonii]